MKVGSFRDLWEEASQYEDTDFWSLKLARLHLKEAHIRGQDRDDEDAHPKIVEHLLASIAVSLLGILSEQ